MVRISLTEKRMSIKEPNSINVREITFRISIQHLILKIHVHLLSVKTP